MAGRVARGGRLRFIKFHFITNEPLMLDIDDLTAVQSNMTCAAFLQADPCFCLLSNV